MRRKPGDGARSAWQGSAVLACLALLAGATACAPASAPGAGNQRAVGDRVLAGDPTGADVANGTQNGKRLERAIFAGGCFWCMQPPFDKTAGVVSTRVGYTGGSVANPSYGAVAGKRTGHREAIEVWFRPDQISYVQLLRVFWRTLDPTDAEGQFADRGSPYHPGIFYVNERQRKVAQTSKEGLARSGRFHKPIVVPILSAKPFYPAERYHQKYYLKDPQRYEGYKRSSGRAGFLKRVWSSTPTAPAAR